ncbi:MAG TPA: arabinosyltransferase domain-containing protein [Pseudonocardiaceae bacterium]|nr:arabinosyltransferase domain-containing protein [Pseudonocardiaceae bacterium]
MPVHDPSPPRARTLAPYDSGAGAGAAVREFDATDLVSPPDVGGVEFTDSGGSGRTKVLAALAVLTLLAAVGVLLAPVTAQDPVVSWPRAGELPRSTVVPLVPYRPLSLDARVPCATLAALDQRAGGGEVLRTLPGTAGQTGMLSQGLVVAVRGGVVRVSASGRSLLAEPLPAGGCVYRVMAAADGVRVLRDGLTRADVPVRVPRVSELSTDLDGLGAAAGLAVRLHTDARYESSPTAPKTGLLVICAGALLVMLVLAWRWWGGQAVAMRRFRFRVTDAVLLAVSGIWVVLAPTNFDDSWYLLMARDAHASGSIGNAIYMFNVTESPFVASQYVLAFWGALGGWGLAWMRLIPLIYGLITWLLLRLLVTGAGPELDTPGGAWALLVAHLLWWLPYGMTLRPEPLIVLLAAAVMLLAERARRRQSAAALAGAVTAAALALTVSPSGLVALAPLVLAAPWCWSWMRAAPAATRWAATLVLAAAAIASVILVGCADATLGDVLEATAVHQWYYQAFPWYQEYIHYRTILSFQDSSQWARRAPVILTIAVLALVALSRIRLRKQPADAAGRLLVSGAACSALALALLAPTPTKFVNHFGAAAAAPTVLLAVALLRSPLPRLAGWRWAGQNGGSRIADSAGGSQIADSVDGALSVIAAALLVGAVSWSFAGPNIWRPYSDRGQPFGDHSTLARDHVDLVGVRPKLGPVPLASPLLWAGLALAAACAVWWWRRHGREIGFGPERAVLVTGSSAIVVMTLMVFGWAPLRQYPGWTVALSALRGVQGQDCALSGYAQILLNTPDQLVPANPATGYGAFAAADQLLPRPPAAPGTLVWSDGGTLDVGSRDVRDVPASPDTASLTKPPGLLVTPWFTLPAQGGSALLVPVLGLREGQGVALEYATGTGEGPGGLGSVALRMDRTTPDTEWQQAAIPLTRLGTHRPQRVRLVIHKRISGADTRLAVGQPQLASWQPLSALTGTAPVYVDQLTAALLPCLHEVSVRHGIAAAPEVLVLSDEGFGRGFLDLAFEVRRGGVLVPAGQSATTVRVPTRLMPDGAPWLPWGRVERVIYDHPVGLVELRVDQVRRAGWTRLPTLAAKNYHGEP